MTSAPVQRTKRTLALPRQRLVELMPGVNFGRLEGLHVPQGAPLVHPTQRGLPLRITVADVARVA